MRRTTSGAPAKAVAMTSDLLLGFKLNSEEDDDDDDDAPPLAFDDQSRTGAVLLATCATHACRATKATAPPSTNRRAPITIFHL
jgi:hypothetical protein